jgi:predicted nucleic acid-binding protein
VSLNSTLQGVKIIFLDTAPIIYFIENHPQFSDIVEVFIEQLDQGNIQGIISPVTVAECLVNPLKNKDQKLQQDFVDFMLRQKSIRLKETDVNISIKAAQIKANYNLKLPDALQVATAIIAGCDSFLTNDKKLSRISELQILVISDFVV